MTYVDCFNHRRRDGTITDGPGYTTSAATRPTTTVWS
jgi:hypothetical protein